MVITNGQEGPLQDFESMPVLEMLEERLCDHDVHGM